MVSPIGNNPLRDRRGEAGQRKRCERIGNRAAVSIFKVRGGHHQKPIWERKIILEEPALYREVSGSQLKSLKVNHIYVDF